MAINFPNSPSTNDIHTENSISWRFNGVSWDEMTQTADHGELDGLSDDDHPQYLKNVNEDTTPQLGGDLDAQGHDITGAGNLAADTATLTTSALTSSAAISWDASAISQPTLTLAHNTTITISNLTDGQTVDLGATMGGSGGHSVGLAHSGLTARQMGNALADIAALAVNDLFEISIKRVGSDLRYWVSTLEI